jgi:hypothetical protein
MSRYITYKQLVKVDACGYERRKFKKLFGDRVLVTKERAESVSTLYEWGTVAQFLLSDAALKKFWLLLNAEYERFWNTQNIDLQKRDERYCKGTAAAFARCYNSDVKK